MAKKQSSNFDRYLNKSRKGPIIAGVSAVAIIAAIVGAIAVQMSYKNKLETAKALVKQLDADNRIMAVEVVPENDDDGDGIKNSEEEIKGTNPLEADTDGDGISDADEFTLGTDPLSYDSDGDGLSDGCEAMAKLNPSSSSTDGINKDGERKFDITRTNGELTAQLNGSAVLYETILDTIELVSFSANESIVTDVYEIYNDAPFDTCKLIFSVDKNTIKNSTLSVFRFNPDTGAFEQIKSQTDSTSGIVSADISRYGTYMVGEVTTVNVPSTTRVHFLIDNSGSMYPESQCANSPENDVKFKRLSFAKALIDKFDETYQIAVSKFTANYNNLQDFTSDKKQLNTALNSIKTEQEFFNGTYIQSSLLKCIDSFKTTDKKTVNIIVMLTDGDTTEETSPDIKLISEKAKGKNVVILTVSIGNDIDKSVLKAIASETGGKYYSASDANALDDIHKQIVATLDYDRVNMGESTDFSGTGYMLYNTGFVPAVNGYNFTDFRTTEANSVSYGLAVFARDWYTGTLPLSLDKIEPSDEGAAKYSAEGYDLTGTSYKSAMKAKQTLRELSAVAVSTKRFTDCLEYLDFKKRSSTLSPTEKLRTEGASKGWNTVRLNLHDEKLKWDAVEFFALDIKNASDKIALKYGESEGQFYKAINRLNAIQWNDSAQTHRFSEGDAAFELLKARLSDGVPAVITINDERAVNAVALIRDSNQPNKYILRVYDTKTVDQTTDIAITKYSGGVFAKDGTYKSSKNYYKATIDGNEVSLAVCDTVTK